MSGNKLQPAFLGGLFAGILSALPLVSIGNCCCLWVLGGGVLASYFMLQRSPAENTPADGLAVGLLAGVIGAVIYVALSIPIDLVMGPIQRRIVEQVFRTTGEMPPGLDAMLRETGVLSVMSVIAMLAFGVIMIVFSSVGGLIGVVVFRTPHSVDSRQSTVDSLPTDNR